MQWAMTPLASAANQGKIAQQQLLSLRRDMENLSLYSFPKKLLR
jgi:hypothetical protein